jgi:hypothetical protein
MMPIQGPLSILFTPRSLFLVPVVGILALTMPQTGLTKETLDPVHDVQWYKTHEAGRKSMLAKCHNNPGQLALTPNCVNAEQAAREVTASSPSTPPPPLPEQSLADMRKQSLNEKPKK